MSIVIGCRHAIGGGSGRTHSRRVAHTHGCLYSLSLASEPSHFLAPRKVVVHLQLEPPPPFSPLVGMAARGYTNTAMTASHSSHTQAEQHHIAFSELHTPSQLVPRGRGRQIENHLDNAHMPPPYSHNSFEIVKWFQSYTAL